MICVMRSFRFRQGRNATGSQDVCTVNELTSLSQRFAVAKMLKEKRTYLEIAQMTGASTATISRVNRALIYGSDGYTIVLDRLGKN